MSGRVYQHLATGKFYRFVCFARNANDACGEVAVYKQLYGSTLRGTNRRLPRNSVWTRPVDEFFAKFKPVGRK